MIIWGNHSSTQYPDISHCLEDGKPAASLVQKDWVEATFIPVVQQRGAAIIKARGASSAASAASAAIDLVTFSDQVTPTEIARVIRFLASDDSAATSGATIPVYGLA